MSGSGGKRTMISGVNLDESDAETMVNVVPGSKRKGKWQGTIEIKKGTMKLKVCLPFTKSSSSTSTSMATSSSTSSAETEVQEIKKIKKEKWLKVVSLKLRRKW